LTAGYIASLFMPQIFRYVYLATILVLGIIGLVTGSNALYSLPPALATGGLDAIETVSGYLAAITLIALGITSMVYATSHLIPGKEKTQGSKSAEWRSSRPRTKRRPDDADCSRVEPLAAAQTAPRIQFPLPTSLNPLITMSFNPMFQSLLLCGAQQRCGYYRHMLLTPKSPYAICIWWNA